MKRDLLSPVWGRPQRLPQLAAREWEDMLGQARQARLLARLAQHFVDHDWLRETPPQPRLYLEGALRLMDRQRHEVQWEVDCIRRALLGVDAPVVLLKGAAYLMAGLPPARGRLFSDIDILVPRDRLPQVESALLGAGWISEERDAYNQRYYRQWMHEIPPMKHVRRNTVIDVHHTIAPPTSRFHVDGAKLLAQMRPLDGFSGLFILAPADMVLHSAVHLFQEGQFGHGLRDLLDLNDLLLHFALAPDFWPTLFSRAQELGLREPLFHALHHIQRLFGTTAPAEYGDAVRALRPGWVARSVLSGLLTIALKPEHPSCDGRLSIAARWLLYVRSHYLRMPLHLMLPHLIRKAYMRRFPKDKPAKDKPVAKA